MKNISIIVAVDQNMAIGKDGGLLCRIPYDMKHFKEKTLGHAVIMGRNTFDSLPDGPLPERKNIVLTTALGMDHDNVVFCAGVDEALKEVGDEQAFVIGGASVYRQFIDLADTMYVTFIHHTFEDPDTFFPDFINDLWLIEDSENHYSDDKNPYDITIVKFSKIKLDVNIN